MGADKALFAPMPLRAMAADLSGLQLRALLCVAAHDRMSLIVGKGQGCRASNERMSQMLNCSYARICSTLSELVELEYLQREKSGRHTVYRVLYSDLDRLLFGNLLGRAKVALSASSQRPIGCRVDARTSENPPKTASQYIPLNGGIDLEESREESSVETARFAARLSKRILSRASVGAELATIERDLKANKPLNRIELVDWIGNDLLSHPYDETIRGWATRLADDLIETMTPDEHATWLASAGASQ
jgi:hypothetical protein